MDTIRQTFIHLLLLSCWIQLWGAGPRRETLFQSKFQNTTCLAGWTDVHQHTPPGKNLAWIAKRDGMSVLQTGPTLFGISHPLKHPIRIQEGLHRIIFRVTLLQPYEHRGAQLSLALSSRRTVAQDAGQAFWNRRDSGIMVKGYGYSLQYANYLAYRVEGMSIFTHRGIGPFSLLEGTDRWTTWTLVYEHGSRTLSFYNHTSETVPALMFHKVELDGVVLNSLWLCAWGTLYRDVSVVVEYHIK